MYSLCPMKASPNSSSKKPIPRNSSDIHAGPYFPSALKLSNDRCDKKIHLESRCMEITARITRFDSDLEWV